MHARSLDSFKEELRPKPKLNTIIVYFARYLKIIDLLFFLKNIQKQN